MKVHNLDIYHCLCCGSVIHSEPDADPPQCCGRPMVKAAAETISDSEGGVRSAITDQPCVTMPSVVKPTPKPR